MWRDDTIFPRRKHGAWSTPLLLLLGFSIYLTGYGHYALGRSPPETTPYIIEYDVPTSNSAPLAITVDSEGNVWFFENNVSRIVKFRPTTGSFDEYQLPTRENQTFVWDMTADSRGNIWFTDATNGVIWKFDVHAAKFYRHIIPTPNSFPLQLAFDSKGSLWFTELSGNKIARLNPLNTKADTSEGIDEYTIPTEGSEELPYGAGPAGIAVDRFNNVWFVETYTGKIAVFNVSSGTFKKYTPPRELYSPTGIAIDAEGSIWVADHGASKVARFNPSTGTLDEYPTSLPSNYPFSLPYWIIVDGMGNVWWNEHAGNKIAVLKPASNIMIEYHIPTQPLATVLDLALDARGNVWFTELTGNKIGVVNPSIPVPFTIHAAQSLTLRLGETQSLNIQLRSSGPAVLSLNASSTMTPSGHFLPTFATARFTVNPVKLDGVSASVTALEVKAHESLQPGRYRLTVSATDGKVTHSTILSLVVETPQDFIPYILAVVAALASLTPAIYLLRRKRHSSVRETHLYCV